MAWGGASSSATRGTTMKFFTRRKKRSGSATVSLNFIPPYSHGTIDSDGLSMPLVECRLRSDEYVICQTCTQEINKLLLKPSVRQSTLPFSHLLPISCYCPCCDLQTGWIADDAAWWEPSMMLFCLKRTTIIRTRQWP